MGVASFFACLHVCLPDRMTVGMCSSLVVCIVACVTGRPCGSLPETAFASLVVIVVDNFLAKPWPKVRVSILFDVPKKKATSQVTLESLGSFLNSNRTPLFNWRLGIANRKLRLIGYLNPARSGGVTVGTALGWLISLENYFSGFT